MSEFDVDATVDALRSTLGQESRRSAIVASNLANVDTPGYRALEITFDEMFSSLNGLRAFTTHSGHLGASEPSPLLETVSQAPVTRMRLDGNTVDLDREMMLFSLSQGRYRTAAEMLRKRFALLVYTATDGRAG